MEERHRRPCTAAPAADGNIAPGMIVALAIIAVGILFLLDNFGFPVGMVWSYWPVILIAVGLAKLIDSRDTPGRTGGAIIMIVGLVLIADKIHLPFFNNISIWALWPLALITFGIIMFWGSLEGRRPGQPFRLTGDGLNQYAVFGGGKRRMTGEFKGGDVFALFGGYEIDLRGATMSLDEAVINANAMFGGIEIRVPETWLVEMQVTGIFGGHEDKTHQPDRRLVPNPKKLIIRGAIMFGGLSVKN